MNAYTSPFDAFITVFKTQPQFCLVPDPNRANYNELYSTRVRNVGSMNNAKKHAREFAKIHNLKPAEREWRKHSPLRPKAKDEVINWDDYAARWYTQDNGTLVFLDINRC